MMLPPLKAPQGSPVGVGVEEASVFVGEASLLIVGVDDPQGSPVGVGLASL